MKKIKKTKFKTYKSYDSEYMHPPFIDHCKESTENKNIYKVRIFDGHWDTDIDLLKIIVSWEKDSEGDYCNFVEVFETSIAPKSWYWNEKTNIHMFPETIFSTDFDWDDFFDNSGFPIRISDEVIIKNIINLWHELYHENLCRLVSWWEDVGDWLLYESYGEKNK